MEIGGDAVEIGPAPPAALPEWLRQRLSRSGGRMKGESLMSTLSRTAWMAGMAILLAASGEHMAHAAEAPDTISVNGKIITVNPEDRVAGAVAVKGDRIQAVGQADTLRTIASPSTLIIDLGGKVMIPGIIVTG